MMNRRTFTFGMVQTLTATKSAHPFISTAGSSGIGVDSHAHIFTRTLPLASQYRYAPDYDASLDQYLAMLDRYSVQKGVLVQPSFLGNENAYLISALRANSKRLRGIVVIEPSRDLDRLDEFNREGCVGIRLNLIGLPDPDLSTAAWAATFSKLRDLKWFVEFHVEASRLPALANVVLQNGLRIVVDHFGRPDPKMGVDDPGFRPLLDLGKTGNVWIKLSGAYRNGANGRGEEIAKAAMPLFRTAFGLDRLVWGSDWPHTQFEKVATYLASLKLLDNLLPDTKDRNIVLRDTPSTLFRFD